MYCEDLQDVVVVWGITVGQRGFERKKEEGKKKERGR